MKGKLVTGGGGTNGGVQTDLLVCFPSRAHLALMPKPICSPSRPAEPAKRYHSQNPKKTTSRARASPLFKTKSKHTGSDIDDEPTSPKVTCAGQIKVRPTKPRSSTSSSRPSTDKNWISVVEEIERIREQRKKKPSSWLEAIGIKKDALQIFSSLHGLRFNMGCFGSLHGSVDCTSDDEDGGEDDEQEDLEGREDEASGSKALFSKWFMVLEENQATIELKKDEQEEENGEEEEEEEEEQEERDEAQASAVPPPNALLLMRCRSAPANGWLDREGKDETENETEEVITAKMIKEDEQDKEKFVSMSYAPDFFKVSMDIAKETWVVGGDMDFFARSRSWKK